MYIAFTILLVVAAVLVYGSVNIASGIYLRAFCKGDGIRKEVALTFDDGPHPVRTPKVLDILKAYDAKAAFFVKGSEAERYPEIIARIADEGHIVGNHTYSHSGTFPFYGRKRMLRELERCNEAIAKVTGSGPAYFRPPFGVTNPNVAWAVRKAGLQTVGWSIRSFDTMNRPRGKVLARIFSKLHKGGIILLHDDREGAPELTRELLEELGKKGYKVVRFDHLEV